jgi:hypothetical protein
MQKLLRAGSFSTGVREPPGATARGGAMGRSNTKAGRRGDLGLTRCTRMNSEQCGRRDLNLFRCATRSGTQLQHRLQRVTCRYIELG